ncbi:MAG: HAD-IC family P-type ATPase, partial [Desulfurococcaceae archaeon]
AAIVEVSDTLRPEAPEVIKALKELGFKVGLASGDIKGIVEKFREELKLDFAEGELRPMDKAEIIQRLQSNGGRVLFIGDGVNDAIAMSTSFIGIAMGKASDIAKNSGDAILLTNDLRGILKLYDLSRKVNKLALENLIWAFIYNTTLIPIAAGALYPQYGIVLKPEWAALAMILSDITVILNSLRVGLSKAK